MSSTPMPSDHLERYPLPYEEFLALPEGVRAEYVDGEVIVSPPASRWHNKVQRRLTNLLEASLPSLDVAHDAGIHYAPRRHRIPDIAVFPAFEDVHWSEVVPVLVAEILSPTTRREDMFRKSGEYLAAGVGQYWIVDLEAGELTVLERTGDTWAMRLELDAEHPRGTVAVGDHGTVAVDLETMLAR